MRLKNKKKGKAGEISGTINILTALALNHADHLDFARIHGLPPPPPPPRQMHQWHQSTSQRGYRGNRRRDSYSYNSQRGFSRGPYTSYNDRNYKPANHEYASSSSIMTSSPGSRKSGNLNLFPGSVNNIACSVLRDTGCSTVGIKSSFIKPEDYTGETTTCVMFDGSECTLPTAHAHNYRYAIPQRQRHCTSSIITSCRYNTWKHHWYQRLYSQRK